MPTPQVPFRELTGITAAPDGTLFACDHETGLVLRIGTDQSVTRFAGTLRREGAPASPVVDGPRLTAARFNSLRGILHLDDGTLVVSDGHCLRRIDAASGMVTTLAGSPARAGAVDASQENARFHTPAGLAVGPDGCIYVADMGNHLVRRVSRDGREVGTWAGLAGQEGNQDGPHGTATLARPMALAFGRDGWLHVIGQAQPGLRRVHPRNGSIGTLVQPEERRPEFSLASDHGRLATDGAEPVQTAWLVRGWGLAATAAGDLLVTVCDRRGTSGGVMQVTEPLAEPAPDAPGREHVAWGLDGELGRLFPFDPSELEGADGEAPRRVRDGGLDQADDGGARDGRHALEPGRTCPRPQGPGQPGPRRGRPGR